MLGEFLQVSIVGVGPNLISFHGPSGTSLAVPSNTMYLPREKAREIVRAEFEKRTPAGKSTNPCYLHENKALLEIGTMLLRYRQGELQAGPSISNVDEEGFLDIEGTKVRFLVYVENNLAGVPVADLSADDLGVLLDLSGRKNRLPKTVADALSLFPRATYLDALQSGIMAVRQLEMVNSWVRKDAA